MHVVFQPKKLSAFELQQGMIDCYSDFYSYTNAFNDALDVFFKTLIVISKKLFKRAHLPSIMPPLTKMVGKQIVKNWILHNRAYMRYLKIMNRTVNG